MKCLFYFKEKIQRREERSAPLYNQENKSYISGTERLTVSTSSANSSRTFNELYEQKSGNLRSFSYHELVEATYNFSRQLKIGEGGFGSVYKGTIKAYGKEDELTTVAIKKLNKDGFQGHKQWVAEVQFLGILEHPNLVKLIGYCAVDGERGIQRLLVYEYMSNKSLEDRLFNAANDPHVISWATRLEIALGAAHGLAFLHEESQVQVIYRDFKTSNVLLDHDFKPKLSDFGLAREGPTAGHTHVSTAAVGTFGYAAPDYIETGHLTSKSDVWSFGVVLYEILTGRRALERSKPRSEQKLLDLVKDYPSHSKKFSKIIDPKLENHYSLSSARALAKLADSCLVKSAKDRPKMSQVVETLKMIMSLSDNDMPSELSESEVFDDDDPMVEKLQKVVVEESESSKRRMAHLAKLSEHLGGVNRKGLMILHRDRARVV